MAALSTERTIRPTRKRQKRSTSPKGHGPQQKKRKIDALSSQRSYAYQYVAPSPAPDPDVTMLSAPPPLQHIDNFNINVNMPQQPQTYLTLPHLFM